jgi:hypothetical protein
MNAMTEHAINRPGHDALWLYFGLSYASWLTLPRAMMHAMPDDWQARMAALLSEWDSTWDWSNFPEHETLVSLKHRGRFCRTPEWMLNYRHPDKAAIDLLRAQEPI